MMFTRCSLLRVQFWSVFKMPMTFVHSAVWFRHIECVLIKSEGPLTPLPPSHPKLNNSEDSQPKVNTMNVNACIQHFRGARHILANNVEVLQERVSTQCSSNTGAKGFGGPPDFIITQPMF